MKITAVGGGSGGHVTPVLAVINELAKHDDSLQVTFVCDSKFASLAGDIMSHAAKPVAVKTIAAGKLRRYNGVSVSKQLSDLPTVASNLFDLFKICIGFFQSLFLLIRNRPDALFLKGGFVCLPIGLAAQLLKIPTILHDSDAHPGLTNRLLAKRATAICTGAPITNYPYDTSKMTYVGVPFDSSFKPVSDAMQRQFRVDAGLPDVTWPVIVVTGGGLGALRLNTAVASVASKLNNKNISIIHVTGQHSYRQFADMPRHAAYIVLPFVADGMYRYLGAADIVVTRAGATALAEVSAMELPTIIVPNDMLTGGHQTKNAAAFSAAEAAIVLSEKEIEQNNDLLYEKVMGLVNDEKLRKHLSTNIATFAKPDAALDVAHVIISSIR